MLRPPPAGSQGDANIGAPRRSAASVRRPRSPGIRISEVVFVKGGLQAGGGATRGGHLDRRSMMGRRPPRVALLRIVSPSVSVALRSSLTIQPFRAPAPGSHGGSEECNVPSPHRSFFGALWQQFLPRLHRDDK